MIEPQWVRLDVVLAIHAAQLAEHGGLDGLRDRNGLESAIASPRNLFAYGSPTPDIAALAAQYAFAIACNQVFLDGNKRTALVVCRTFPLMSAFSFLNGIPDTNVWRTFSVRIPLARLNKPCRATIGAGRAR